MSSTEGPGPERLCARRSTFATLGRRDPLDLVLEIVGQRLAGPSGAGTQLGVNVIGDVSDLHRLAHVVTIPCDLGVSQAIYM